MLCLAFVDARMRVWGLVLSRQEALTAATIANIDTGGLEPLLEEMLKLFDTTEQLGRGIKKLFHHLDYVRICRWHAQ